MTAHELAAHLLTQPDIPVIINGWGSGEGFAFEVAGSSVENYASEDRGKQFLALTEAETDVTGVFKT